MPFRYIQHVRGSVFDPLFTDFMAAIKIRRRTVPSIAEIQFTSVTGI